jgi:hypothetical protein
LPIALSWMSRRFGDSETEAHDNLQIALRLFLEEAAHLGTLKDILIEAGMSRERYFDLLAKC